MAASWPQRKNQARSALIAALRQDARRADHRGHEPAVVVIVRVQATSTNRTSRPLAKPVIIDVDNFQARSC